MDITYMFYQLYPFIVSTSFVLYCLIFIGIFFYRKKSLSYKQIIINGIWFSEDGSIAEDAINNFVKISKQIKKSKYKSYYQLFFWTDTKKLNRGIKKKFNRHSIVIKDYRDINPNDKASKEINEGVSHFLSLGNKDNKYFYCLASDLFRFYLLFKEFPENYNNAVTWYIDCNDIDIKDIPSPNIFQELESVAFNFMYIRYRGIFQYIIGYETEIQPYFNNDVILVANKKNKKTLDLIFDSYYENLKDLNRQSAGIYEILKATRDSTKVQDKHLALVIVFAMTHMTNILRLKENLWDFTFLFEHREHGIKLHLLTNIQDARYFINFVRDLNKGLTWGENINIEALGLCEMNEYRNFWHELYNRRYHLINNALDDAIAASNVALLLKYERQAS